MKKNDEVQVDRRAQRTERRAEGDRRQQNVPVAVDRRKPTNEPRRKAPRRRQIDPTTCERDYNLEEIEFMQAMDAYKRASGRMFPTCSEILEVIRSLGYQKIGPQNPIVLDASGCPAADSINLAPPTEGASVPKTLA